MTMQTEKAIIYCERMGYRALELDLYRPDGPAGDPRPLLVYIHGGGFRLSHRSRAPRETREWDRGFFERLTDAGFVVAAPDYRFSLEATYPAQIDDSKEAVRWLRANAPDLGIDPGPVYVWGASGGGYLAACVGLATDVGPVGGVVCWYAITDFTSVDQETFDSHEAWMLGGPIGERGELAVEASATTRVHADAPPFHLVHGTADEEVAFDQSVRLDAALREVGAEVTFEVIEGADHFWVGAEDQVEGIFDRSLSFVSALAGL
jgi:acetyl esterase/lipase